jgi:hypothetical protein
MSGHEHFEELCALAASGQIAAEEWLELREHLEECHSCGETLGDFGNIGTELLTEYSSSIPDGLQAEMRSRFLERAKEAGTQLADHPVAAPHTSGSRRSSVLLYGLMAASVLLAIGVAYSRLRTGPPEASLHSEPGAIIRRNEPAQGQAQAEEQIERQRLLDQIHSLERDKETLQAKLTIAGSQDGELEARLEKIRAELEEKNRQLAAAQSQYAVTAKRLVQAETSLQKAESKAAAQEVQITLAKADKEKLAEELVSEKAGAEQARALLAANKDGQSLLAARNLHIVDVYDADTQGKRKSFGRIFYVENQELIFYAYDLSDPRHANAEFYAWGSSLAPGEEVARLGVLHNDGQSEKRWILKYNDASVLAKVDSIFVTAEMASNPEKPKGKHVLFAVLAGQPNHP